MEAQSLYQEDWLLKQHSSNTYIVKEPINELIVVGLFNNLSSKQTIEILDENFNVVESVYNDSLTFISNDTSKYYCKITKKVDFIENNASETRYTWILFEYNPETEEELTFSTNYAPQIWREEPTKKW